MSTVKVTQVPSIDFEAVADPCAEVDRLRERAAEAGVSLPECMTLATVGLDGRPHARVVLLRGRRERAFHFFTNYESSKARELQHLPLAELCVHYVDLAFQTRVSGPVRRLSAQESDAYFATRPRESQLAAWASQQSAALESRELLERRWEEQRVSFEGREVPRPPHWGGFALDAERVELWLGKKGRLHDRAVYRWADGHWDATRLFP